MNNKFVIGLLFILGITAIITGIIFNYKINETSKNEVVCTLEDKNDILTIYKTYTLKHENDKLKKYSKVFKYQYKKENEEFAKKYKGEGIQKLVATSKNVPGVDISISENNYTITNSFIYDLEIFNPETSLEYSSVFPLYSLNDSVETIVEEITSWGFTCK